MNWIFVRMFLMNKPKYEDCSSDEERCIWMIRNVHKLEEYPSWVEVAKYKGFAKSAEIANFDAGKHRKYQKAMLSDQRIASIEAAAEKRGKAGKEGGYQSIDFLVTLVIVILSSFAYICRLYQNNILK